MTEKKIGLWSTISIGIGGMVGGGIFAVLGLSVQLSKGGTPMSFFLAGIIALITSYSYAKLSVAFPSQGGTVDFLNQAYGNGRWSGGLNVLLWLSYVVMLSLYAEAFGSYGAVFFSAAHYLFWKHVMITSIILVLTLVNMIGAAIVGKSETAIVFLKMVILLIFIVTGAWSIHWGHMAVGTWSSPAELVTGGMIIFVAYEGFELIANTAADVINPKKNLPKAYYISVGFVIALYVLVAMVTVGNLSLSAIAKAQDYALAEASKPFLGSTGFILVAIAALLSTASAINATLYGASKISYMMAKEGELPVFLEKKVWNNPLEGLWITAILTLFFANFLDLSSISTIGSAGFLIIFAAVNYANSKLSDQTASKRWISLLGALLCIIALALLIYQSARVSYYQIVVLLLLIGVSFAIEFAYYKFRLQRQLE